MSLQNAFLGSLVADAVSMPVHWYYDRNALDRDYGDFTGFCKPQNPHPDSILWRSSFVPKNAKADILGNQIKYWGQQRIHYHQFLEAGENTLNLQLAAELYRDSILNGGFDPELWLKRYVQVMLTPGWHQDTYAEECHRAFFQNYASGKSLLSCGIPDYHIGGLSQIPALLASMEAFDHTDPSLQLEKVLNLVRLTHNHEFTLRAATDLTRIFQRLMQGEYIRHTLKTLPLPGVSVRLLEKWENMDDRTVVGDHLSTACYLPESFVAALHFAWKYHDDFSMAILANAKAGGDNCHRGVVVGSIVAMQTGIPEIWLKNLRMMEKLRCDIQVLPDPKVLKRVI
ncbi:MAG TPA: ADP-ribosylglycohydrolase [Opitutae bacterium]|nr:ADP-ribosylglycohydrolase family protein [Verrucomicrobiota bacterium]HAY76017.1 ADP-ribosylglycohydrolase [Opitutae bacterium]